MAQRVEVPGLGIVEFPDGTPKPEMQAAIGRALEKKKGQDTAAAVGTAVRGAAGDAKATFDGYLANAFNSATFGLGDEIVAAGRDLFGIQDYDSALSDHRNMMKDTQKADPTGAFLASLAGGVAVPGIGFAKAAAAPTLMGKAFGLAGAGALTGGVTGFASGEGDFGNRAKSGAQGAVMGGLLAPALVGGANLVGKGVGALVDSAGLGTAGRAAKMGDRKILQALQRSGLSVDDLTKYVDDARALGAAPIPADASTNLQKLYSAAGRVPGEGAEIAADVVGTRQAGQGARMDSFFEDLFGSKVSATSYVDDLSARQQATARPLYDAADAVDIPIDRAVQIDIGSGPQTVSLKDLLQVDDFKAALKQGYRLATLESGPPVLAFDPKTGTIPTRIIDLAKRGLDSAIDDAGAYTTTGRALTRFKAKLLAVVDDLNPDYKSARTAWAGPQALKDAVTAGKEAFTTAPEDLVKVFQRLTPSEQPAFRIGVLDAIKTKISAAGDGRNKVITLFGNPRVRAQMEAVLGPDEFAKLTQFMQVEGAAAKTYNSVSRGSQTAERLAEAEDLKVNPVNLLEVLRPGGLGSAALRKFSGYAKGMTERSAERIVKSLGEKDPTKLRAILDLLKSFSDKEAARMGNRLRQGATYGVGIGGAAIPGLLSY